MATPATFDRSTLGEKTRVHVLAKQLGLSSKEVIAQLAELGLKKVAQSALTKPEVEQLLDAYEQDAAAQTAEFSEEEKLRYRVEKNVENEIHQIEEKVAQQLAPLVEQSQANASEEPAVEAEQVEQTRRRVEKNVANEISQLEAKVDREIKQRQEEGLLVPAAHDADDVAVETADAPAEVAEEPAVADEPAAAEAVADKAAADKAAAAPAEDPAEFHWDGVLDDDEPLVPLVTPAPAEVKFQTPLFMAPTLQNETHGDDDFEMDIYATEDDDDEFPRKRRRGRRGTGRGRGHEQLVETHEDETEDVATEPVALKGSTRLEAQRRRRVEMREESRKKRHIVSEAEFLARRESVERTMVVRERERNDHPGLVTQVGVLEDDLLVEHFVTSDTQASMIGNIYLGRVQNVLPSMEAAFIDIGKGRNGVLYAGEVDWRAAGLGGRQRKIEQALKSGDQVLVQVAKDPIGHKGARLTTQISLAGRYLVYVPGGRSAGISRKLPAPERKRLKHILREVVPRDGGVIIRTAAEGVSQDAIAADVQRLHKVWEQIQQRTQKEMDAKGAKPVTMYEEPNMLVKVIRDLFNEDFSRLVVDGKRAWNTVHAYIQSVAPELLERLARFDRDEHDGNDVFNAYRVDEQLQKALSRKVWLPSGGTLVIDRTEAMTVIDVNTGKFTGQGGNLEETVTKNNLEAAEEIVRQMRLRDLGGMIVVDFIDMVLPENQDLVLRRLTEALGRDRTRHQISEVTSLGLVQITRKRLGTGLLETFSTECDVCDGRGVIIHDDPVEHRDGPASGRSGHGVLHQDPTRHPAVVVMQHEDNSQDDQVQHESAEAATSSRRNRRNDTAAPATRSNEELAAAVIAMPDDAHVNAETEPAAPVVETEVQEDARPARRSRRRGQQRGGAREVVPTAADTEFDAIIENAVTNAKLEDPDQPSGEDYLPQTYEEAVAAFEASPRRKRKVRGNSISDHAPKPEDYGPAAAALTAADETAESQVEQGGESHDTTASHSSTASAAKRRGRGRRGVKKSLQHSAPQAEGEGVETSADDTAAVIVEGEAEGVQTAKKRRAVRKRLQHENARGEQAVASVEAADTEEADAAADAVARQTSAERGRRGKRRAVKKAPAATVESSTQEVERGDDQDQSDTPVATRVAGRTKRRAVRRKLAGAEENSSTAVKKENIVTQEQDESTARVARGSSRGRRRAVRRQAT
ncbi:translation initiation factor IF-2 N-terminal domain-containing protein [Corynebacterium sp. HS2168-gen11]|uniref:translation initiation factor IF-2 N-terminal domain-containing protein n=1 Tax=Corynebacterium sp. HS2168-gen11 TaxID=2974027 RepID=UPI00216B2AB8|nr:translation initiation factor IF-2 N-terminal domain-containing protein [Corynebacterium sp. HS2168-gen11]MCS4535333.1 translation initiation factor IF-2 N-terminal domain-containing protein [Corynebacterium sp. HS2168-gen11]